MRWYQNSGTSPPTWTARTIGTGLGSRPFTVTLRDINADGRKDVVSASGTQVVWYENLGGSPPTWSARTISTSMSSAMSVCTADVEGKGRMDVVHAGGNGVFWFENLGGSPPSWAPHLVDPTANTPWTVVAVDINNNGAVDFATASAGDGAIRWFENIPCPAGKYGANTPFDSCTLCPPGRYGVSPGLRTSNCSGPCSAGTFGGPGLTSAACNGNCAPGYACPAGSTNATAVLCAAGYVCATGSKNRTAAPCGGGAVYCPVGSGSPLQVPVGWYSTPEDVDASLRSSARPCPSGSFCVGGVRAPCPAGRFGCADRLVVPGCNGPCTLGFFCPTGSNSSQAYVGCVPVLGPRFLACVPRTRWRIGTKSYNTFSPLRHSTGSCWPQWLTMLAYSPTASDTTRCHVSTQ